MTKCTTKKYQFTPLKRCEIVAAFDGQPVTSDAGGILLREADRKLGLTASVAQIFEDPRNPLFIKHSILEMVRQRIFGLALGYEDLNDHDTLRNDPAMQTIVGYNHPLASSPTLCRFENNANRKVGVDINKLFVEKFIASYAAPPEELILDFDATDDIVHGSQEGRFFHGYYDNYCFLPLYVFCGDQLLIAYLRTADKDGARHTWAILSLLVKRFRQEWPNVRIVFRGDSGFNRHRILSWCEKNNVGYIVGQAKNKRLKKILEPYINQAELEFKETNEKKRIFCEFNYAAGTWGRERKIIGKAEHTECGSNPRFIVTNLSGDPQALYDNVYCARGEMENRIKEVQLGLFSDRTSCHNWWPNQLRMLFSACAYVLVEYIRRTALTATVLANAQVGTIRLKLFKIGAIVTKNTRRIRFSISSSYPLQSLFAQVYEKLVPI